jgi:hypothetical protein
MEYKTKLTVQKDGKTSSSKAGTLASEALNGSGKRPVFKKGMKGCNIEREFHDESDDIMINILCECFVFLCLKAFQSTQKIPPLTFFEREQT